MADLSASRNERVFVPLGIREDAGAVRHESIFSQLGRMLVDEALYNHFVVKG